MVAAGKRADARSSRCSPLAASPRRPRPPRRRARPSPSVARRTAPSGSRTGSAPSTSSRARTRSATRRSSQRPQVDGYITRIRPDLTYLDGRVPGVDVIHLHHGVWVNTSRRSNATRRLPRALLRRGRGEDDHAAAQGLRLSGQGDRRPAPQPHDPQPDAGADAGLHGLRRSTSSQGLAAPRAGSARCGRSGWTCRTASLYPVFNVARARAATGASPIRDDAKNPYGGGRQGTSGSSTGPACWSATAGHLHPGGLHTDLKRAAGTGAQGPPRGCSRLAVGQVLRAGGGGLVGRRDDRHRPDWRVKVRKGDVLSVSATYDTQARLLVGVDGHHGRLHGRRRAGHEPFKTKVNSPGTVTHGHLPENDNHGGGPTGLPDPRQLPDGAENPGFVDMVNFQYQLGDLSLRRPGAAPAGDPRRPALTFRDAGDDAKGDLSLDHVLQGALQPLDGHRVSDRGRRRAVRVGHARHRGPPATGALEWKTPDEPLARAPTRTSAGSTRSCAGPSGSSSSSAVRYPASVSEGEKQSAAAAAGERVRAVLEAAEQSAAELRAEAARGDRGQLAQRPGGRRAALGPRRRDRALAPAAWPTRVRDELSALKADLEELRAVGEGIGAREARQPPKRPAAGAGGGARSAGARAEEPRRPPRRPRRRPRSRRPNRPSRARLRGRARRPGGRPGDRPQHGAERVLARGDRALPLRELRAGRPRGAARRGLRPRVGLKPVASLGAAAGGDASSTRLPSGSRT